MWFWTDSTITGVCVCVWCACKALSHRIAGPSQPRFHIIVIIILLLLPSRRVYYYHYYYYILRPKRPREVVVVVGGDGSSDARARGVKMELYTRAASAASPGQSLVFTSDCSPDTSRASSERPRGHPPPHPRPPRSSRNRHHVPPRDTYRFPNSFAPPLPAYLTSSVRAYYYTHIYMYNNIY